jgi:hypothetical protein
LKTHILHLIVSISLFVLVQGCNTNDPDSLSNTLNVTLKSNASYQYDLGYFGVEEGAIISISPKHFKLNKLDRDINSGKVIYTYVPSVGFTGTDTVELKSMRGSDGASANNNITTVLITFKIID